MAPAVVVVLAGFFSQHHGTHLETCDFSRLQIEPKDRPMAFGGPHSRQNLWQPQANSCLVRRC